MSCPILSSFFLFFVESNTLLAYLKNISLGNIYYVWETHMENLLNRHDALSIYHIRKIHKLMVAFPNSFNKPTPTKIGQL
jgi:hypothetical protein